MCNIIQENFDLKGFPLSSCEVTLVSFLKVSLKAFFKNFPTELFQEAFLTCVRNFYQKEDSTKSFNFNHQILFDITFNPPPLHPFTNNQKAFLIFFILKFSLLRKLSYELKLLDHVQKFMFFTYICFNCTIT